MSSLSDGSNQSSSGDGARSRSGRQYLLSRIWELTHGFDSNDSESVIRDPNPQHVLIDEYRLLDLTASTSFTAALVDSLSRVLRECEGVALDSEKVDILNDGVLVLERHLDILDNLKSEDIKRLREDERTRRTCREAFEFVFRNLPAEGHAGARRRAFALLSRLGEPISDGDVLAAVRSFDTCVVAFRHAVKLENGLAIVRLFPDFVHTVFGAGHGALVKIELMRLRQQYSARPEDVNFLIRRLEGVVERLPENIASQVRNYAAEQGLEFSDTRPVKETIGRRLGPSGTPELFYVTFDYVLGSRFRQLNNDVVRVLAGANGATAVPLRAGTSWTMIALELSRNSFDFCAELYFKTPPRGRLVDVIQLGTLRTFTAVIDANSSLFKAIGKMLLDRDLSFEAMIVRCLEVTRDEEMEIGLLSDTAASMVALDALASRPRLTKYAKAIERTEGLAHWLTSEPDRRIVICDHGIASEISDWWQRHSGTPTRRRARRSLALTLDFKFQYVKRVPVGFAYPVRDLEWGREIRTALAKVLMRDLKEQDPVETEWKSWKTIRSELAEVGIQAFTEAEICEYLGIRAFYDLRQRRAQAVQAEKYEDARALTKEIADKAEQYS